MMKIESHLSLLFLPQLSKMGMFSKAWKPPLCLPYVLLQPRHPRAVAFTRSSPNSTATFLSTTLHFPPLLLLSQAFVAGFILH